MTDLVVAAPGVLRFDGRSFHCALGRGGVSADKREGDGATPLGRFPLRRALWRPDRMAAPVTGLAVLPLSPDDGWCDDPAHPDYNRPVRLPHPARCEALWREDGVYDVIVVVGHNDDPPVAGLGSAIFMHVARPGRPPTEGCVALDLPDLLALLTLCRPGDSLVVAR
ncbi:MAG: L,D-transpeptidase family protein [Alphaproteobacteria bacterium]|nr:L,D-transpeptidase family protein [Alphaproteobacteria bacterium]